jgi:hypothetical protein
MPSGEWTDGAFPVLDPRGFYSTTSVGVPDESRAAMGMALLFSGEAAAAEASAGWLLDPATVVRRAAANALGDAARKGKVTPTIAAPHDHDAELAAGGPCPVSRADAAVSRNDARSASNTVRVVRREHPPSRAVRSRRRGATARPWQAPRERRPPARAHLNRQAKAS